MRMEQRERKEAPSIASCLQPFLPWIVLVAMAAFIGFCCWLGSIESRAAEPSPLSDPALRQPAFHPGDDGVIDLRRDKGEQPR
jgi:hypothetical protein